MDLQVQKYENWRQLAAQPGSREASILVGALGVSEICAAAHADQLSLRVANRVFSAALAYTRELATEYSRHSEYELRLTA